MNKEYLIQIINDTLKENNIYADVNVYQVGNMEYKVNVLLYYEEYLKMVCLSETEITDKLNIEIDFTIMD